MSTDQELQYQRTFLSLPICRTIYNEDDRYHNYPGGPPNRQRKIESDPVFKYHVHSCPRYPQRAPGSPVDRQYQALLAGDDGSLKPVVIIPKRGQQFLRAATEFEREYSELCTGQSYGFKPIVNSQMEVTGHYNTVNGEKLIGPKLDNVHPDNTYPHNRGAPDTLFEAYLRNDIPVFFWGKVKARPSSWRAMGYAVELFTILVLPNGDITTGWYSRSTDGVESSWSPFDFGNLAKIGSKAITAFGRKLDRAVLRGYQAMKTPTKELAELSAKRVGSKTLIGVAVSPKTIPVAFQGRKALVLGDDMADITKHAMNIPSQPGLFDVIVHGDKTAFFILKNKTWQSVSARDLANAIRNKLAPNDKIRLIGCETGAIGGPAQQLANELGRNVFAPTTSVYPKLGSFFKSTHPKFQSIQGKTVFESVKGHLTEVAPGKVGEVAARGGVLVKYVPGKSLVPVDGGTFKEVMYQDLRGFQ